MTNFNPFAILDYFDKTSMDSLGIEKSRLNKVLSSGFIDKMKHSYYVFQGKGDFNEDGGTYEFGYLGILDWAGLSIPYLLWNLLGVFEKLVNQNATLKKLLFLPMIILIILLIPIVFINDYLIKPLAAASLTLAVAAPFICLIQPITYAIKKYRLSQIYDLAEKEFAKNDGKLYESNNLIDWSHAFDFKKANGEKGQLVIEQQQISSGDKLLNLKFFKGNEDDSCQLEYRVKVCKADDFKESPLCDRLMLLQM